MLPLEELIQKYNPTAPLSAASTPPASWYTDSRVFELEQRTVFSRSWQMIGRADQVREPGEYITADLAGQPLLIVRGQDGILRGFYNVCRHHAAAVLTQPQGKADHLRCPYHGWTYNLQGALVAAPEFGGVCNFDKTTNGLIPVQTAIWQGWVLVKLVSNGPSLEEFLGKGVTEQVQRLNLEQLSWFERRSYTVNCNWKVFVDNYLDGGYHVPHIHGDLSSLLDYNQYKVEIGEHFSVQSSPIVSEKADRQTAQVRQGRAFYYWIYPNFMINWYEGVMDTNLVIPRAINKTEVVFDYYFAKRTAEARENNLASIAVSEQIQDEDVAICESVQRGLSSFAYSTGRLSVRREAGEHLFHRLLYADLITDCSLDLPHY